MPAGVCCALPGGEGTTEKDMHHHCSLEAETLLGTVASPREDAMYYQFPGFATKHMLLL